MSAAALALAPAMFTARLQGMLAWLDAGAGHARIELMGDAWTWKHMGSFPLSHPVEGSQIAATKEGVKEIIDQHFRQHESVELGVPQHKISVSSEPAPMHLADPALKAALHLCLGKVFHYTGGTRRYVCASVHCFGIQEGNPDYIIGMDLMALSGSEKGCNPTNDTVKDIGSKWILDKDQTVTFKGKMAAKLASMYKWKSAKPLKPQYIHGTAVGTHVTFEVGAAAAGAAPRDPAIVYESVYDRMDRGCLTESMDSGALRRLQDLKSSEVGSPEFDMLKKALHNDLRSGMLSKDMEQRVRDVLAGAEKRLADREEIDSVNEVADRLERALYKGKVVPESGEQE